MKTPGVYSIPCKCGKVYTGQTGCSIEMIREHHWHIRLHHLDKLAMAKHSRVTTSSFKIPYPGHEIQMHGTLHQGRRVLPDQVMEAPLANPERMKDGPLL
jgi:hypothetical protein